MVGIQNVHNLNTSVADTATSALTPVAVRPAASAASTAPKPPGVGAAWATTEPAKYTSEIAAIEPFGVNARTDAIRQRQ